MRISDSESHFRAVVSHTSYIVDGYALGEFIEWECDICRLAPSTSTASSWSTSAGILSATIKVDLVHRPGYDGHSHR